MGDHHNFTIALGVLEVSPDGHSSHSAIDRGGEQENFTPVYAAQVRRLCRVRDTVF